LAEEIRDLGISQKCAIRSHLENLLFHLIKWELQPERRNRSWEESISKSRREIDILIEDIPSLKRYRNAIFSNSYDRAITHALTETRLPANTPCSKWTLEQVLDLGFLPE
jgi:hypothetical protein